MFSMQRLIMNKWRMEIWRIVFL